MENKKKTAKEVEETDLEKVDRIASRVRLLSRFFQSSGPSLWETFKKSMRISKEIEEKMDKK